MNKKLKSKIMIGLGGLLVFLIGMGAGSNSDCPEPAAVPEPEVVTERVEVVKEVCPQEPTWEELKSVDDRIIMNDAELFTIAAEALDAIAVQDWYTYETHMDRFDSKAVLKDDMLRERSEVLSKLGY